MQISNHPVLTALNTAIFTYTGILSVLLYLWCVIDTQFTQHGICFTFQAIYCHFPLLHSEPDSLSLTSDTQNPVVYNVLSTACFLSTYFCFPPYCLSYYPFSYILLLRTALHAYNKPPPFSMGPQPVILWLTEADIPSIQWGRGRTPFPMPVKLRFPQCIKAVSLATQFFADFLKRCLLFILLFEIHSSMKWEVGQERRI